MGRGRTLGEDGVSAQGRCQTSWSELIQRGDHCPCTRTRHGAVVHARNLYILGGRKGNVALNDFWKLHIDDNYWEKVEVSGVRPGYLQDHSMVEYKDTLFVFGGEISFCNDQEIPLWIFDIKKSMWKKETSSRGACAPKSLRGHSATVYKDSMFIFGGYQDLKGSNADIWMFHFPSSSWHLVFRSEPSKGTFFAPTPRHHHTAVLHDSNIWIYGGLNNLQPSADLLKFDLEWQTWQQLKTKPGPGCLHSHSAVKHQNKMIIVGGKIDGHLSENIWLFHFATETWEKLVVGINQPQPRHNSITLTFIMDGSNETANSESNKEELGSRHLASSFQKQEKNPVLSSTASKLRQAVSMAGLNRAGAYASLINLSEERLAPADAMDSETSSLFSQAGDEEPFCVFNSRSRLAQVHFTRTRKNEDHGAGALSSKNHEDNHTLFATALNSSCQEIADSDSGVELRETKENDELYSLRSKSQPAVSLLVIGGMLEGQVSWKREHLPVWQMKFLN